MFHLLPLVKGWEYKSHDVVDTITRSANPIEKLSLDEKGWLFSVGVISTDCYGSLIVGWQGADLQLREGSHYAEAYKALGALAQDPSGWVQLYKRPNPYSTAGQFVTIAFSGGHQGALLPYVPTVIIKLYLPSNSTQTSAYIAGSATTVAITNMKLFINSLRRVLEARADLYIDPALFTTGPFELTKLGEELGRLP